MIQFILAAVGALFLVACLFVWGLIGAGRRAPAFLWAVTFLPLAAAIFIFAALVVGKLSNG